MTTEFSFQVIYEFRAGAVTLRRADYVWAPTEHAAYVRAWEAAERWQWWVTEVYLTTTSPRLSGS